MCAGLLCCVRVSLPLKQHEENILLCTKVLYSGCPSTDLASQDVVEDLRYIFFTLLVTDKLFIKLKNNRNVLI